MTENSYVTVIFAYMHFSYIYLHIICVNSAMQKTSVLATVEFQQALNYGSLSLHCTRWYFLQEMQILLI